eukprot:TRINITY_DN807_c0_g1_i4.p1 TRINITY_DN807_c0_g1~~TRINITY_DN807_c0_g1_i4.p1  ORF type:complete len:191 (+),score=38.60 TRINITY_DN807_c0_g1_i4:185-757(+)
MLRHPTTTLRLLRPPLLLLLSSINAEIAHDDSTFDPSSFSPLSPIPKDSRILVIGGTQFMGRLLVEKLTQMGNRVTILNRGKSPSPFKNNSNVVHFKCDRMNQRPKFRSHLKTNRYDYIIDFVCFRPQHAIDVIKAIDFKRGFSDLKQYIFISTDSVYMACMRPPSHGGFIKETDAILPKTRREKKYQLL